MSSILREIRGTEKEKGRRSVRNIQLTNPVSHSQPSSRNEWVHPPVTECCSSTSTRCPDCANKLATVEPPDPDPITMVSKLDGIFSRRNLSARRDWTGRGLGHEVVINTRMRAKARTGVRKRRMNGCPSKYSVTVIIVSTKEMGDKIGVCCDFCWFVQLVLFFWF